MNVSLDDLDDWGRKLLRAATEAATKSDSLVYLVGGPVRDLLRGVPSDDLDLAVERNEDAFANELAALLSATLVSTERFFTWRLTTGTDRHVDLAGVRTETYPHPGALPVVSAAASIEEDLGRRDFTVNAMAIRLNDGLLVDPFGGRADLDARVVRVLHDGSFLDDPTRIFRALRLACRCGLALEPATSTLLDVAVADGALDTVSRERAWKEIEIALDEDRPVPVLRAFLARDCLAPFLGPVHPENLDRLPDSVVIPSPLDARVVLIGALARGCRDTTFESLPWDRSTISRIRAIARREAPLANDLAREQPADEAFAACEAASPEERFLAAVERPEVADLVSRFENAAAAARSIRGDDLGVPPGPWIGRALRQARRDLFAGRVDERDAPAFARRLAMQYLND